MNGRMEGEYPAERERYRITFDYGGQMTRTGPIPDQTLATIERLDEGKWRTYFEGVATRHPNDLHCKETGRKVALADALTECSDKVFRTWIWSLYHGRKGGAK